MTTEAAEQIEIEQTESVPEQVQAEIEEQAPIAIVRGESVTTLPQDLYIPPDALEVILETFEGPLDLLLYLIRRQNLDILDIPVAEITRQYMEYIELMKHLRLELAGEYLVMAAMLAEIKSRMLLPRHSEDEDNEDDPRAELIRRLQEYERFKQVAEDIETLPRVGRDIYLTKAEPPDLEEQRPLPELTLKELVLAFKEIMARVAHTEHHHIQRETLSIRERMSIILTRLHDKEFVDFSDCFTLEEGRQGVVVSFIAILELLKQSLIDIVQAEPFSPIHIRAA